MLVFSFDVESIGLYGEGYAVGIHIRDEQKTLWEATYACDPHLAIGTMKDRHWVAANVPPIEITHADPQQVRSAFWGAWVEHGGGSYMVTDCGYPVEARFLIDCVRDDPERASAAPYPLLDLSTALLMRHQNPTGDFPRQKDELPAHHPLMDARQSARLFVEAFADGVKLSEAWAAIRTAMADSEYQSAMLANIQMPAYDILRHEGIEPAGALSERISKQVMGILAR